MYLTDPKEVEAVLAFFRDQIGSELEVTISVFEGLLESDRMSVVEVASSEPLVVILQATDSKRRLHLNPHHYSFATVAPDRRRLEIDRLLGSGVTLRLTASAIPGWPVDQQIDRWKHQQDQD